MVGQLGSDGAEVAGESKTHGVVTNQGHSKGAEVASTRGREGLGNPQDLAQKADVDQKEKVDDHPLWELLKMAGYDCW